MHSQLMYEHFRRKMGHFKLVFRGGNVIGGIGVYIFCKNKSASSSSFSTSD